MRATADVIRLAHAATEVYFSTPILSAGQYVKNA